jgi:hypothetical protein
MCIVHVYAKSVRGEFRERYNCKEPKTHCVWAWVCVLISWTSNCIQKRRIFAYVCALCAKAIWRVQKQEGKCAQSNKDVHDKIKPTRQESRQDTIRQLKLVREEEDSRWLHPIPQAREVTRKTVYAYVYVYVYVRARECELARVYVLCIRACVLRYVCTHVYMCAWK